MRIKFTGSGLATLIFVLHASLLNAADTYQGSLMEGDANKTEKKITEALASYDLALSQAEDDTERGLAMSKKAAIFAHDQKNYAAAKEVAEAALRLQDTRPVARVTALQVLAECQMKLDKDYAGATLNLETAMKLDNVEWAMPGLALSLGDCHRFSGQFDKALEAYEKVQGYSTANPPVKAVAFLNMALTYQYNLLDPVRAKESYAKAVQLNPGLQKEVDAHLLKLN